MMATSRLKMSSYSTFFSFLPFCFLPPPILIIAAASLSCFDSKDMILPASSLFCTCSRFNSDNKFCCVAFASSSLSTSRPAFRFSWWQYYSSEMQVSISLAYGCGKSLICCSRRAASSLSSSTLRTILSFCSCKNWMWWMRSRCSS